ncbi:hypothetical protein DIPPA_32013 [Diplonema papillatum]|nr:hypothetical protein DIPPA_32013 [Diplonema papillatum]
MISDTNSMIVIACAFGLCVGVLCVGALVRLVYSKEIDQISERRTHVAAIRIAILQAAAPNKKNGPVGNPSVAREFVRCVGSQIEPEWTCCVCLSGVLPQTEPVPTENGNGDSTDAVVELPHCAHQLHLDCASSWFEALAAHNKEFTCPLCREAVPRTVEDLREEFASQMLAATHAVNPDLSPETSVTGDTASEWCGRAAGLPAVVVNEDPCPTAAGVVEVPRPAAATTPDSSGRREQASTPTLPHHP